MPGHRCPLCGKSHVPMFRFACPRCFDQMPSPMRRQAVAAWKFRVSEPARYADTLVGVLQWYQHRQTTPDEKYLYEGE